MSLPKPKYDNVVMKKEPKIHLDDEPLQDLNVYDDWLKKKLKTKIRNKKSQKQKQFFPIQRQKQKQFFQI